MATDYKKIAEEHRVGYGSFTDYRSFFYEQLYKEKTHFTYELIQNAVDSKSSQLELRLKENELFVWNDGDQFSEKDVRSICSLGSSSKDLTQIGTFGIGFKSVYNYTDCPEIYSGDEHFCIRDLTQPEGIDKMTPKIVEQVSQGRTVFRLPFKDDLSQKDIVLLKDQFCKLGERYVLLFLRDLQRDWKKHFKTIRWIDERDGQTGICSCIHHPHSKIQDASEVELTMSLNGENQLSEMFLVFHKVVQPPQNVIDALLKQTKHDEKRQKIQQSAKKQQPIEIAFKLHDGSITAMDDNCVLFAYLPTLKETHLKFLIQARYQTTSGRADIQDPSENPWNRWLVRETAKFLPEILEQLKASDLLEPAFFNILPLSGDDKVRTDDKVPLEFEPIVKALEDAMGEKPLVPTQDGGYAKAENVFYPESTPLRKLVTSSGRHSDSSLLHPYIRKDAKESERCFDVMAKAGVKEIKASDLLCWLEKRSLDWFKNRTDKWLRSLYIYFNRKWSESEWERIKKLPLVRLENEEHVCASDQLVFFPPDTDEDLEDIKPFLNDLPILQSILLEGEDLNDIKSFLDDLDVRALHPKDLIREWIIPQYFQSDQPSEKANLSHVYYLFKVWDKLSGYEQRNLRKEISETPILWAYNGVQPQTFDFVKPCDAYLPKSYTGDTDLETYFSVSDGDIWFVDSGYLDGISNLKEWIKFLRAIGAMDTPRVDKIEVVGSYEECEERDITWQRSTREFENGSFIDRYYSGHFDGAIEDFEFAGLLEVLNQISDHNKVNLSYSLWSLLIKAIEPLSSEKKSRWPWTSNRDAFFQCTYRWFYNGAKEDYLDATFYRQLKETAWLPDEQGKLRTPSECFAPTTENRRLLGDSVIYLHPDFDISEDNEAARWLADNKLNVNLNADINSVLNYLETLSSDPEVSIEQVEPLYRFLAQRDARRSEEFKQKPLIFTSNPEPRWWRSDQVLWEDKHEVFGNHRGYLEKNYAGNEGTLERFFAALGVLRNPSLSEYAGVIREITSIEQADDPEVRDRVETLYRYIMPHLREADNSLENEEGQKEWDRIREGKCWLGKKGDEWGFFFLHELVWKDDHYRCRLFKDKVRFWAFDNDLVELAKNLGVKGCYEISDVKFNYCNEQGENQIWSEEVRNLHPYIHDFLHSPNLRKGHEVKKSAEILDRISVCRTEKLEVEYTLREFRAPDPNPRQSFLDEGNQTLWLGLEEDEKAYPDLIGDALQDYFSINELREFVKDLLPSVNLSETSRLSWERRGFQADHCLLPPKVDSKEDEEKLPESFDKELPNETGSGDDSGTNEPENETSMFHEKPETANENDDSTGNETETPTYRLHPSGGGARPRVGNRGSTSNGSRGTGHSGDRSDSTEDDTHMEETGTSSHARKEIERIGMEHARRYEEEQGCTVEDVSTENLGFDLRSTTPNGEIRCIEVKARSERTFVLLTPNEWRTAKQLKDDYFLYIVLNAGTQPQLYIIPNPADTISEMKQVTYHQVPLSEIEEHGKLV